MSIYYQDDYVTLYHGDSFEAMASMADKSVDCVITDPPYAEKTHSQAIKKANGGLKVGIAEFSSFTEEQLDLAFDECGRLTKGWVIATLDYNHAFRFESQPPANLRQLRIGVWVKQNATPQITGDRPAQGWEAISYLHRKGQKAIWNGGGHHGNYVTNIPQSYGHPTPKSVPMFSNFIERFTNAGDTIFDPFAGGGTTLVAAKNLGRKAIGVELEEKYCELIAKRLSQDTFDFSKLPDIKEKETYTHERLI